MNKITCKDCGCEITESYVMVNSWDNEEQLPQCFNCYEEACDLYMTNDE